MATSSVVYAQGVSITGVGEGSVIILPASVSTTNLTVTATPAGPSGGTNMAFSLEYQGGVIVVRTSAPPYSVTLSNLTAGKYYLSAALVMSGSPPKGDVSFDISAASVQPSNDNWNQAVFIPGFNTTVIGTNTFATSESSEPVHHHVAGGKSLWWKWSAPSNGLVSVTTAGSGFDTVLGIYKGTNLNSLIEVASSDDAGPNPFSQATFFATNGTTYYIAVDGASAAEFGTVRMRLLAASPPAISMASPADGALFLVASPTSKTNVNALASVSDPAGIARTDYWFDGAASVSNAGILPPPYQLNLLNLSEGHYLITLVASNNAGLVSVTNVGFSVISIAPVLFVDGFSGSNAFRVAMTGFKGTNYALRVSTNLEVWCAPTVWTNFAGAETLTDTNAVRYTRRFYGAATVP